MTNIFAPTFGYKPQYIVGREKEIADFTNSLPQAPGHPNRTTLFIGQRGMGKTVLLLELAERADNNGFIAVRTVASDNMLSDIIESVQIEGQKYTKTRKNPFKSVSAGVFGFSVGLTFTDEINKNYGFRAKLSLLCEALAKRNKGVLFLIDEIRASSPVMREFATTYQHLVGDGYNVAAAMAGLPGAISSVLNDEILTFLNRAHKATLGPLPISDVSLCYANALRELDINFSADAVDTAARATDGYPYLLQLIGYNMLKFHKAEDELSKTTVELAVANSKRALVSDVFMPCLTPLSAEDKRFLKAMAQDDTQSRVADIRRRLGVSPSHIQTYKHRLADAGLICVVSRGVVAFSVPYIGQYLRGEF